MSNKVKMFFDMLAEFQDLAAKYGLNITTHTHVSKKMLMELPVEYQIRVMKKVIDQMAILKTHKSIQSLCSKTTKKSNCDDLSKLGLYLADEHYQDLIMDHKDSIQVLAPNGMMLFCNWTYLLRTNYDLLTLNLFSYQELFERSYEFSNSLDIKLEEVLSSKEVSHGLPLHTMKAHLNKSKKLLLCNIKQFLPITSAVNNERFVLVVSFLKEMGTVKETHMRLKVSV